MHQICFLINLLYFAQHNVLVSVVNPIILQGVTFFPTYGQGLSLHYPTHGQEVPFFPTYGQIPFHTQLPLVVLVPNANHVSFLHLLRL